MTSPLLIDSDALPGLVPNSHILHSQPTAAYSKADANNVRYVEFANPPPRETTRARIDALRKAAEDEEIQVHDSSENDLHRFLLTWSGASDPRMSLLDNGNFRILWDSEDGRQIGLQFLGNDSVQFVLFAKREGADQLSRSAGRDTVDGVVRQIRGLDLLSLLYS
jgi:hypothetical protein